VLHEYEIACRQETICNFHFAVFNLQFPAPMRITMSIARKTALLVVTLALPAFGQQGWSQVDAIKQAGKAATLNALYYDGEQIWIVGADGLALKSEDNGHTWQPVQSKIDAGLNDVFVLGDRMWMVGDAGTVLFSKDRGRTFVKNLYRARRSRKGDSPVDLYSVQFVDKDRGYVVGDDGLILTSGDGGVTWREQQTGTDAQLFHLSFQGNRGWVVGSGGTILHTDDGGKTWHIQRSDTREDLNRVNMVTDDLGFISGNKGTLLRTENGGATWQKVSLRTGESLFGISFIDKKTGWVVGYSGIIVRTYDGGRKWVEQVNPTSADLFAVSFNKNRGFAIGRDGLLLRYYEKR
jgi:photosystem II stability/assembly factor-like uncharacterized protein